MALNGSDALSSLRILVQEIEQKEIYGVGACNGVLFNHESPRRGETFVTPKITRGLARVDAGLDDCQRDWGYARDTSSAGSSLRSVLPSVRSVRNWKSGGGRTWSASAAELCSRNSSSALRSPEAPCSSGYRTSCSLGPSDEGSWTAPVE